MGVWQLIAVTTALVCSAFVAASEVVVLTPDNIDQVLDGGKHVFVKFYAPWCGHCKNLAPTWDAMADSFKKEDNVVIAKCDVDEHKEIGSTYGISGFPTLKFFPLGSTDPEDYSGGRSQEELTKFINEQAGTRVRVIKPPSYVAALTEQDFDAEVIHSKKHAIVEFFAPWCGHCKSLAPIYEEVGKIFAGEDNVLIASVDATEQKQLAERYKVSGFPTIKYFAPGSEDPEDYSHGRDKESFVEFVNEHAGTFRTTDGGLTPEAGLVKEIDELIAESKAITGDVLEQAELMVTMLEGEAAKHGNLYVKAMKKILAKGETYVETEIARLGRMLESDNVNAAKKKLFGLRKNILQSFVKDDKKDEL